MGAVASGTRERVESFRARVPRRRLPGGRGGRVGRGYGGLGGAVGPAALPLGSWRRAGKARSRPPRRSGIPGMRCSAPAPSGTPHGSHWEGAGALPAAAGPRFSRSGRVGCRREVRHTWRTRGRRGHIREDAPESPHPRSAPLVGPVGPVAPVGDSRLPPPPGRASPAGAGAGRRGAGPPLKGPPAAARRTLPGGGEDLCARQPHPGKAATPEFRLPAASIRAVGHSQLRLSAHRRPAAETARLVICSHQLRVRLPGPFTGPQSPAWTRPRRQRQRSA